MQGSTLKKSLTLLPVALGVMLACSAAQATVTTETDVGTLSFGGDVEFNLNTRSVDSKAPAYQAVASDVNNNEIWGQDGRILFDIGGIKTLENGKFAQVHAQPSVSIDGTFGADDAWFGFGQQNDWMFKVGHFEAYDLFPNGMDIFVDQAGNSADDNYSDTHGYVYKAKEGRGRTSGGLGQVLINKNLGKWYAELSTQFGDKTSFFSGDSYHGYAIDKDSADNTVLLRPVVAWQATDTFKVALGGETNLIPSSVSDMSGTKDFARRNGGGLTTTYAKDDFYVNFNLAYMSAFEEKNATVGLNGGWGNWGVGYVHANNEIKNANTGIEYLNGTHNLDTYYAAYKIGSVMDIKNFDMYLGAYYSKFDPAHGDSTDRLGGRVRFKYFF